MKDQIPCDAQRQKLDKQLERVGFRSVWRRPTEVKMNHENPLTLTGYLK